MGSKILMPAVASLGQLKSIPGGYVVKDATGQALAYVYARETRADADTAKGSAVAFR